MKCINVFLSPKVSKISWGQGDVSLILIQLWFLVQNMSYFFDTVWLHWRNKRFCRRDFWVALSPTFLLLAWLSDRRCHWKNKLMLNKLGMNVCRPQYAVWFTPRIGASLETGNNPHNSACHLDHLFSYDLWHTSPREKEVHISLPVNVKYSLNILGSFFNQIFEPLLQSPLGMSAHQ